MASPDQNKANVKAFYDLAFNQRQPEQAVNQYVGSSYRQHNPMAGDGPEPFIGRGDLTQFLHSSEPRIRVLTDVPRYATWERLLGDRIDHSSFEAGLKGLAFAALPAARGAARTAEVLAP